MTTIAATGYSKTDIPKIPVGRKCSPVFLARAIPVVMAAAARALLLSEFYNLELDQPLSDIILGNRR